MNPLPGDYFVVNTGDNLVARVIRWATRSTVNHAGVYLGDGRIVEAQPGGAVISPATRYPGAIWSTRLRFAGDDADPAGGVLLDHERDLIVEAAERMAGVPYNTLDIVVIGLAQRRLGRLITPRSWIARRLSRGDRLICSQLVDAAYLAAGLHLFADGRPTGLVSPGDLLNLLPAKKGVAV